MKTILSTILSIIALNLVSNASSIITIETSDTSLIHVYKTNDYFTKSENYIQSFNISPNKNKITLNSTETAQYILKKNNIRYTLFVEPNSSYSIKLSSITKNEILEYLKTRNQPIRFKNGNNNINIKLIEIENIISEFYLENEDLIQFKKGIIKKYVYTEKDSIAILQKKEPLSYYFKLLKDTINKKIKPTDTDFFKTSVKYIIALQEKKLFNKSKKYFYTTYIENQKAYLNNPYYINFITLSFANYAFTSSFYKYETQLQKAVLNKNYDDVDSIFKLNDFLSNKDLRNYIEIITIKKYYDLEYMNKGLYIKWLKLIEENNALNENSIICKQLIIDELTLSKGSQITTINGINQFNDSISIPYKKENKYYYIQFINKNCSDCSMQIKSMKTIQKTYGKWVYLISIYLGEEEEDYLIIKNSNTFYWPFLYLGLESEKTIDELNILSNSEYLLLNNKGQIESYPAKKPMDDNIMNTIYPEMEKIMMLYNKKEF